MTLLFDEIQDLIKSRRSIRRYLPLPIATSLIEGLLENAGWAPSAHNRQPWRFKILQSFELKHALALKMGQQLKAARMQDNDDINLIDADVARSYARIVEAPVVLIVFLTLEDMDKYPDPSRNHFEYIMAVQSTAMAVQNLLLSAHAANLGACWMCAPLFCMDTVNEVLDTPSHWQAQAMITLGYPAQKPKYKARKKLTKIYTPERILW